MDSEGPGLSSLAVERVQNPALPWSLRSTSGHIPLEAPWLTQQLCCVGLWSKHLDVWSGHCTEVACGPDGESSWLLGSENTGC